MMGKGLPFLSGPAGRAGTTPAPHPQRTGGQCKRGEVIRY